jgi:hypothetical protein
MVSSRPLSISPDSSTMRLCSCAINSATSIVS